MATEKTELFLKELSGKSGNNLVLMDEVIEFESGWAFMYQSKAYLQSGDFLDMLVGNSPFIINKYDGHIQLTGTAYSIEKYIEEYILQQRDR